VKAKLEKKESLNIDGTKFHKYQQNGQPPLTPPLNIKQTMTYGVGNPSPGFGQSQK